MRSSWIVAPLALLGTACSSWYRAGPQVRVVDGQLAVEGKATIEGGVEQVVFPLALSGGVTPDDGEDIFALETGMDYLGEIEDSDWAYVAGPRFVGMLSGPTGTSVGMNGGPIVPLDSESSSETVLALELFAGFGTSGEVRDGFVGGATVSIGSLHRGVFRIPSGRRLRRDGNVVTARAIACSRWCHPLELKAVPRSDRRRLGERWLRDALDEHASILAFHELALDLALVGAPPSLVRRAKLAADDEARHARICFSIASAYLGRAVGPGPLPRARPRRPSLPRLAREALVDGCFGEGLAAELAWSRRARARDPAIFQANDLIARDEARHAELAWDVLAFAAQPRAVEEGLDQVGGRPDSSWFLDRVLRRARDLA
jgi:hypothetical protein